MTENKQERKYLLRNFYWKYDSVHNWRNNITISKYGVELYLVLKEDKLTFCLSEIKADFKKWNRLDIFIEDDCLNIDLNNSRALSLKLRKEG